MEKRAVAPLVLGGAGVALAVAIVVLLVKVRAGAPAPEVHPADVTRAAARPAEPPAATRPAPPPPSRTAEEEEPPPPLPSPPPAVPDRGGEQVGIGELAPSGEGGETDGLAAKMTEANRLYDRGDYEAANQMAEEILWMQPNNVKMRRIGASSACILGDANEARTHYDMLPESDKQQIARRCKRYGVEF